MVTSGSNDDHECFKQDKCVYDLKCPHSGNCLFVDPPVQSLRRIQFDDGATVVLGPVCELTTCPMAGVVHGHGVGVELGYV